MKTFVAAATLALASIATAQLDLLPPCSTSCFLDALQNDGCPSITDFACHCEQADTLFSVVTPCVQDACTPEEEQAAISAVEGTCASAGVTISIPSPTESASSAASSSEAPESTEAPESSTAEPTPEPTSEAPSSEAPTSEAPTSESMSMPTPTGNATMSSTTPTPTEFTGGAAATQAPVVLGAAALALLAL
ncbi:CFEM-domain-containing protein [Lojkania enalia]|uniref:CFEM-domain-containing protein n=1 Tax=Lojkania enalia TaxID=147567 RepID=A0A9P4KD02_9PLEO|nr:CFEM-domain-containing protein [Didymosphaeria enalia]